MKSLYIYITILILASFSVAYLLLAVKQKKYGCDKGICSQNKNGIYKSMSDCIGNCNKGYYSCNKGYNIGCSPDPDGPYKNLDACNSECNNRLSGKYSCSGENGCTTDPINGIYKTMPICMTSCARKTGRYSCNKGDNIGCSYDREGPYEGIDACLTDCNKSMLSKVSEFYNFI